MFATVECVDGDVGFRGFMRDMFLEPQIDFQRIQLSEGDPFYRVRVKEYRGQIPVRETFESLGRLKGSVLFTSDFPHEDETLIFRPKLFGALLLLNSAYTYIKKLSLSPLRSSLTIFDSSGIYADKLSRFVPLFSKIEVYTRQSALYEAAAKRLLAEYGLSLTVTYFFDGRPPESTVIISYDSLPFAGYYRGIIFTGGDFCPPCGCALTGEGLTLPAQYELLRPGGIDKMPFAAALYEKSAVKSLGELEYNMLKEIK